MIDPTKFPGPGQRPDLQSTLAATRLSVAKENPSQADIQATKLLLDYYKREDGWHCPRCSQVFNDPHSFAEHIAEEFNKALESLPTPTPRHPP